MEVFWIKAWRVLIIILLLQCTIRVVHYNTVINHLKNIRYMIEVNNISPDFVNDSPTLTQALILIV